MRTNMTIVLRKMAEAGFRNKDRMELPCEEGHDVISPLWVTNIPRVLAALTINLGGKEPVIPKARRSGLLSEWKRSLTSILLRNLPTFYHHP